MPRGWGGGVPGGGGRLPPLWRASGVRRCPSPGRPSSGAGSQGSATRVSWVWSVQAGGPCTGPTALALAVRRCAPWGWREGVPGGVAVRRCEGRLGSDAPPPPAARPLGGLPGLVDHVLWARVSVCAVCVVSVRCVSWCAVPLFCCISGAPLSGASVRCCARRVPAVPPSLRVFLARLATPCIFRGFVALYPFLYPSPWHALFPCLRSGACLGLFPCRLVILSRWAFSSRPVKRKDANGRAAAGVLSCHGTLSLPSSVGLLLLRWCGMLPSYASFVFSSLLMLTVLCLLRRILVCVV